MQWITLCSRILLAMFSVLQCGFSWIQFIFEFGGHQNEPGAKQISWLRLHTYPWSMSMTNQHSSTVGDVGLVIGAESLTLQTLPVELLAEIFSELDLDSLIMVSCLSHRLRAVIADASLNPWRRPILRNLHRCVYEKSLFHLSVRSIVPRQNWIEILTFAPSSFLLFDSTLPNLKSSEWEECFRRRFLPGWIKWKKDGSWRETFMKSVLLQQKYILCYPPLMNTSPECFTVYGTKVDPPALRMSLGPSDSSINLIHTPTLRPTFPRYIVVNRNGSVNELEATSRNFNPFAIFHEMKSVYISSRYLAPTYTR